MYATYLSVAYHRILKAIEDILSISFLPSPTIVSCKFESCYGWIAYLNITACPFMAAI